MTIEELKQQAEKNFDLAFKLDDYGKSTAVQDKVKQFLRGWISEAYEAGRQTGVDKALGVASNIANDVAHELAAKWEHERIWTQPYAGNRLIHLGWEIGTRLRLFLKPPSQ